MVAAMAMEADMDQEVLIHSDLHLLAVIQQSQLIQHIMVALQEAHTAVHMAVMDIAELDHTDMVLHTAIHHIQSTNHTHHTHTALLTTAITTMDFTDHTLMVAQYTKSLKFDKKIDFPTHCLDGLKEKSQKNHFVYTHDDKKKETRFLQSNLFFILPEMKYIFFCNTYL